jgi:hypothetical protein
VHRQPGLHQIDLVEGQVPQEAHSPSVQQAQREPELQWGMLELQIESAAVQELQPWR